MVKITSVLQKSSKIILGIDPGTIVMGYGVILVKGKSISLIEMNVLKLNSKKDAYERLELIHHTVGQIIKAFKPTDFAIEAPFFGKNVQSMLKLGRAQGVAIAAAMQAGLSVCEYSPKKVKQSITGNGNADKEQVLKMLQTILQFEGKPQTFDASDAVAVALCHHFQDSNVLSLPKGKNDWKSFIANNPSRISSK
ncbi:crossover junction endodeoxyribonuclease RuvC [Ferruginibacter yonginensis]|uniref:Crossover junction endodeoxyribonuclease RuvC n=1 Tax=Ferruginibacter yonginensis TaxID=1310416 RepID=A0ABV8QUF2_9BACT